MLIAPLLALTACAGSIPSAEGINMDAPPPSAMMPCKRPVLLPDRALSQAEAEGYSIADRRELISCAGKQKILATWATSVVESIKDQ